LIKFGQIVLKYIGNYCCKLLHKMLSHCRELPVVWLGHFSHTLYIPN